MTTPAQHCTTSNVSLAFLEALPHSVVRHALHNSGSHSETRTDTNMGNPLTNRSFSLSSQANKTPYCSNVLPALSSGGNTQLFTHEHSKPKITENDPHSPSPFPALPAPHTPVLRVHGHVNRGHHRREVNMLVAARNYPHHVPAHTNGRLALPPRQVAAELAPGPRRERRGAGAAGAAVAVAVTGGGLLEAFARAARARAGLALLFGVSAAAGQDAPDGLPEEERIGYIG